jgi:hypothetical protein
MSVDYFGICDDCKKMVDLDSFLKYQDRAHRVWFAFSLAHLGHRIGIYDYDKALDDHDLLACVLDYEVMSGTDNSPFPPVGKND